MKHNMHRSRTLSTNQLHNTNGSNGEIEYQTFKEESHAKKQPPIPQNKTKKPTKNTHKKKTHQQHTNKIQQTKHENPNKNPLKL